MYHFGATLSPARFGRRPTRGGCVCSRERLEEGRGAPGRIAIRPPGAVDGDRADAGPEVITIRGRREYRDHALAIGGWTRSFATALAVGALLAPASASAQTTPVSKKATRWQWSVPKVMRSIHNLPIRVGTRRVRIESDTVLCSGNGTPLRRQQLATWSRFSCTFTTFTRRGVGRDVSFEVLVLGRQRFAIHGARWVKAAPRASGVLVSPSSKVAQGSGKTQPALLIALASAILLLGLGALPSQVIPHAAVATFVARRRAVIAAAGLAALAAFLVSYFV